MITTVGKQEQIKFFSGFVHQYGAALAVGVGDVAEDVGDKRLSSEIDRSNIIVRAPDYVNGRVILKATLPSNLAGTISEVGVVAKTSAQVPTVPVLTVSGETWSAGVVDPTQARVGDSALRLNPASGGSSNAASDIQLEVEASQDVVINYFVGANISAAQLRMRTTAGAYYSYALPTTAGYNSVAIPRASFSATSTPSWSNITSVYVSANATGGAGVFHFDALMFAPTNREEDLLARTVLVTPIVKAGGVEMDVEYVLEF